MEILERNLSGDKVSIYDVYKFLKLNIATNREETEAEVVTDKEQSQNLYRTILCMTVHKAKGLEFDTVILPDLNEGNVPSPHSSHTAEEIEEERRLLYVAVTRAKKHLYMFSVRNKTERIAPSRFLKDCRLKFSDLRRFILHRHR